MATETVEALVEGGKATAAPPLGPALGPLGVNIGQVINEINTKTASFSGMQVPVKVSVDTDSKEFSISVGTPPVSQLIMKEAKMQKGSSNPLEYKVADILIEQVIKVAKMKEDDLLGKDLKQKVKEVVGTCRSMGVLVEGMAGKEATKAINEGKFDKQIKEEKTEITAEERKQLEEEKKKLQEEMEEKKEEYMEKAKDILANMKGQPDGVIEARMIEVGIPTMIIKEVLEPDVVEAGIPGVAQPKGPE